MKKIMIIMFALVCTMTASAQFQLTKKGILTEDGNDYYVVEFQGKTAEQIYKSAMDYLMANYTDPKKGITEQPNSMITIKIICGDRCFYDTFMGARFYYVLNMNLVLRFKDGKMRIDAPSLISAINEAGIKFSFGANDSDDFDYEKVFFNKKGKKNEKAFNSFSIYLNSLVPQIIDGIKNVKKVNDNW